MTTIIRPAVAHDATSIGTLAAEFQAFLRAIDDNADFDWGAEKYLRDGFGADPAFEGIVAEVDSVVAGFALFDFGYDTDRGQRYVYVFDLFVSQAFRRKGVGEQLMQRITEIGRARGAEMAAWSVHRRNTDALRFYDKIGARLLDEHRLMWRPI